jgi:hypothetical protein
VKSVERTAFQLSRIYGHGWNAVRKLQGQGRLDLKDEDGAAINPYTTSEERNRWAEGFRDALAGRSAKHTARRSVSWQTSKWTSG